MPSFSLAISLTDTENCAIMMVIKQKDFGKMEKFKKHFAILTVIYIIVLIWGIIFKMNTFSDIEESVNWTLENDPYSKGVSFFPPIPAPSWYFSLKSSTGHQHLLNILVFIPFGFLSSGISRKATLGKAALASFCISLVFEITQLFVVFGGCALLDLIFNTVGGIVGFLFFSFLALFGRSFENCAQEKLLTFFLTIFYIVLLPLAIYGTIKTIIHIDFYITLQNKWLALL